MVVLQEVLEATRSQVRQLETQISQKFGDAALSGSPDDSSMSQRIAELESELAAAADSAGALLVAHANTKMVLMQMLFGSALRIERATFDKQASVCCNSS